MHFVTADAARSMKIFLNQGNMSDKKSRGVGYCLLLIGRSRTQPPVK